MNKNHKLILGAVLVAAFLIILSMFSSKSPFAAEKISVADNNKPSNDTVLIFFAPWCGYCVKAKDEFELAEQKGGGKIKLIDATHPDNKNIVEKYGVKGFPTIIKGDGTKFSGSRTAENILNFADEN